VLIERSVAEAVPLFWRFKIEKYGGHPTMHASEGELGARRVSVDRRAVVGSAPGRCCAMRQNLPCCFGVT
jgi:hypothetical protein